MDVQNLDFFCKLLSDKSSKKCFSGIIRTDSIQKLKSVVENLKKSVPKNHIEVNLIFDQIDLASLKTPQHILDKIDKQKVKLELRIKIKVITKKFDIYDVIEQDSVVVPPIEYTTQIILTAETVSNSTVNFYKSSWHLDKHIRGKGSNLPAFLHPEYHFNMGGFALTKEKDFDFGQYLPIDAPRLLHPPLDIVLAIDFVLQQFYGNRVQNLIENTEYKRYIRTSQKHFWQPYFAALASYWGKMPANPSIEPDYPDKLLGYK